MKLELMVNQPYPVTVSGNWIWLRNALKPITLETNIGEWVTLHKGAVLKNAGLIERVLLSSDVHQVIDVEFGKGDFEPPTEGQGVVILSMPAVEIAANQSIKVSELPAVTLEPGQGMKVLEMPALQLADGQKLEVGALPEVKLAQGQSVQVASLPEIKLASGHNLTGQAGNLPLTIAANPERRRVHIKAASSNTEPVLIAGVYALAPGEAERLDTRGSIELTETETDSVQILEY